MSFKVVFCLFLALAAFCSVERNHFSNFCKGSPKDHFCVRVCVFFFFFFFFFFFLFFFFFCFFFFFVFFFFLFNRGVGLGGDIVKCFRFFFYF